MLLTKRMALVVPIGLLVGGTVAWTGLNYDFQKNTHAEEEKQYQTSSENLFAQSSRLIWKMVREGNVSESSGFKQTAEHLQQSMSLYTSKGFEVKELSKMVELYQKDGSKLEEVCRIKAQRLNRYYVYEHANEEKYIIAMEQIGLPELADSYKNLEKTRQEYIKNPSDRVLQEYNKLNEKLYTIIAELYLDHDIEEPLFQYLKNDQNYVYTIASIYDEVGKERILRIRDNSYAIRTQLQLLPKL